MGLFGQKMAVFFFGLKLCRFGRASPDLVPTAKAANGEQVERAGKPQRGARGASGTPGGGGGLS